MDMKNANCDIPKKYADSLPHHQEGHSKIALKNDQHAVTTTSTIFHCPSLKRNDYNCENIFSNGKLHCQNISAHEDDMRSTITHSILNASYDMLTEPCSMLLKI
ncbi:Cell division protein FtsQ [Dirofilaria immitis]